MKLPIYLAGASSEYVRVKAWANACERTGDLTVVYRWFDSAHVWTGNDAACPLEVAVEAAEACLDGLGAAAVVWLLWPREPSVGAYVELGAALERRRVLATKPYLVVTGEDVGRSIFTAPADYRDVVDALGFHEVSRIARLARDGKAT